VQRRLFLAAGLAGFAATALAQAPVIEWGQIHAAAHQPLPRERPIAVRPLDDKPGDVQLARRFSDALRRAGRQGAPMGGALALNFETEIERVPQTLQRGITDTRGRVKFLIVATVDDPASGQRLWSAQASYLGAPNNEAVIFAQLAQFLVDELGKTVRTRGFTLE